jgi:pimeloyl-ACP methyl ester carboxylesterase
VIKGVGEYEGKIDAASDSATGLWKQGGASLPLTLKKVAKVSEVRRPQQPKGPFPYVSEEVAYDSRAKGVRIAGTLTLPEGDGPFPVVLLITGSGSQDRDETLLGHKPFLVLADDLTRRGVAVLRVDDRGVGESTGDPKTATTADFVEDVLGGVDFLKARKRIDPKRIGLMGHSEGGLIAPIAATRSSDVAFIVLLAGTGVPGDQILAAQAALILKAAGADEAKIRQAAEAQAKLVAIVKQTEDLKLATENLKKAYEEMVKAMPEADRKAMAEADPNSSRVTMLASPWFRYFLTFDPRPTLAKVQCPVLAINGEKDLQVPCKENLEAIDKAIRSGGNTRVTIKELPGLNHLFQPCITGAPSEYGSIETTFDPAALKIVGEWILEQTRAK